MDAAKALSQVAADHPDASSVINAGSAQVHLESRSCIYSAGVIWGRFPINPVLLQLILFFSYEVAYRANDDMSTVNVHATAAKYSLKAKSYIWAYLRR